MFIGFDHVILAVDDIDKAESEFESLGFRVTRREDADPAPFRNRLVCLADGSYIELVIFDDPSFIATHRFKPLLEQGPGWAEAVVWTDSIDDDAARLARSGMTFHGPRSIEKRLSDGRPWSLSVLIPGRGYGHPALPMLAQDTSDHTLRVPDRLTVHPNGVTGTTGILLLVENIEIATRYLGALLDILPTEIKPPEGASAARRFLLAERHIDVASPAVEGAFADFMKTRGEGLVEVRLKGGHSGPQQTLGGARLILGG